MHHYSLNSIESVFSCFCEEISKITGSFNYIIKDYLKKLDKNLRENPIKTGDFPRYVSSSDSSHQKDEELLIKILEKEDNNNNNNQEDNNNNNQDNNNNNNQEENDTNNQEKKSITMFSLEELHQINEILSKYTNSFSFSQKLFEKAIKKFDDFLNALKQNNDQNQFNYFRKIDSKSEEYHCFELILMIKLRLLMMNRQMHDFLIVLLQLIIIDQENSNDHFPFKNIFNEILPNFSNRRSLIIQKVRDDQILDFYFSNDEQNDYILTKEGVFKINKNKNRQVEFNSSNITQINFDHDSDENQKIQQMLKQSNKDNAKIAFSNGILYLFCFEDQRIHKTVVSEEDELIRKREIKQKKIESAKKNSEKQHPKKKETKENKNAEAKKAKANSN